MPKRFYDHHRNILRIAGTSYNGMGGQSDPIVDLWIYRVLVLLEAHREFFDKGGFNNQRLVKQLGLEEYEQDIEKDFEYKKVLKEIKIRHQQLENDSDGLTVSPALEENIQRLAQIIGISTVEQKILQFIIYQRTHSGLTDALDFLGEVSTNVITPILATLLNIPREEVSQALKNDSLLFESGILSYGDGSSDYITRKFDLLNSRFADRMLQKDTDPMDLLCEALVPVIPPTLGPDDFFHIKELLTVIRPYLKSAIKSGKKGVNVFIYGAPGTGKSELAKVLAKELEVEMLEVSNQDEDGDAIGGFQRLRAFRAAQYFLHAKESLLLFDEVEDVFNDGNDFMGRQSSARKSKGWVNRTLENNVVPAIWVSNSKDIDPAFIRRFDIVFEMPMPTNEHRKRLLKKHCQGLLSANAIARASAAKNLPPAVITRSSSVVRSIEQALGKKERAKAVEFLMNNTLKAQSNREIPKTIPPVKKKQQAPNLYNAMYMNADHDMVIIAEKLKSNKRPSARLCLYGPPGTGKSAYGRWLADQLKKKLLVKRASDLLSMWVGGTEQNIAKAFEEATTKGSILLIDEVDSFLQDRRGASRNWEVTGVNEMLVQMENFEGIFIASTNLMEGLDQAALRRFDLPVKFDYMLPEQAWALFNDYAKDLDLIGMPDHLKNSLGMLRNLTPGDFAAISRRHRFSPINQAEEMLDALSKACNLKENSTRGIGFV